MAYLILTDKKPHPFFMRGRNYNLFLFSKETTYCVTISYVHNKGHRYSANLKLLLQRVIDIM